MTVSELIAILQSQPPEFPVYCGSDFYGIATPLEPLEVKIYFMEPQTSYNQTPQTPTQSRPANALVIGW